MSTPASPTSLQKTHCLKATTGPPIVGCQIDPFDDVVVEDWPIQFTVLQFLDICNLSF